MEKLKSVGAGLLLALFIAAWVYIGVRLITFIPSTNISKLILDEPQVTIAGLLAAAVGAGTASVLGIEVAQQPNTQPVAQQTSQAIGANPLLAVGVVFYALVGCFILTVYWFESGKTPDFIAAFALGFLGWLAATFAAVYRGAATPGASGGDATTGTPGQAPGPTPAPTPLTPVPGASAGGVPLTNT